MHIASYYQNGFRTHIATCYSTSHLRKLQPHMLCKSPSNNWLFFTIAQLLAVVIFVLVSFMRENLRELRFFYHKIPTLVGKEPLEDGDYFEQEHLSFFSLLGIFILICIGCYFMMKYCRHKRRQWRNRILPNRKSRLLPKTSVSSSVSASVNSGTSLTSSVKNNV